MTAMPAVVAIGRRTGLRSGLRSKKGSRISNTRQIVGMPIVARNTSSGGLTTRSSSKRKKKYHSGRGVYVVVVGSAFGPSSAPSRIDIRMITASVTAAMMLSFAIAYGKNGLPWFLRIEYSRRYCSRSRAFIGRPPPSDLLAEEVLLLGLEPRRRRGTELGHQVQVGAY